MKYQKEIFISIRFPQIRNKTFWIIKQRPFTIFEKKRKIPWQRQEKKNIKMSYFFFCIKQTLSDRRQKLKYTFQIKWDKTKDEHKVMVDIRFFPLFVLCVWHRMSLSYYLHFIYILITIICPFPLPPPRPSPSTLQIGAKVNEWVSGRSVSDWWKYIRVCIAHTFDFPSQANQTIWCVQLGQCNVTWFY